MTFFESIFYMAWRGIAIGLIISAPMGPVGMLCIQRTLDKGRKAGFYTGIGAALSDLFYCLLTGFGLSFIEEFLERNSNIIQLAGSAVLIAFAIYLFKKNPAQKLKKPVPEEISIKKNILGGFLFTFSNPLILFLIVGLFARFNFLLPEFKLYQYFTGFLFIFVGALIWWWLITFSIDKVRSHFNIRSMWLINRIIGAIILLFAIVGIITATSALCSAQTRCWNEKRGFESFSPCWAALATDEPGAIANSRHTDASVLTPVEGADDFEMRMRVFNLHNAPSKKYDFTDAEGMTHKASLPSWGIVVKSVTGQQVAYRVKCSETPFDGISTSPAVEISYMEDGLIKESRHFGANQSIKDHLSGPAVNLDPTGSVNYFKVKSDGNNLMLFGGAHTPALLYSTPMPEGFRADSIGFMLAPGASIRLADLRLTGNGERGKNLHSPWADSNLLIEYISDSPDSMECFWQILDRSLDENLVKLGGDYRLATVRALDGYDIIYLSGARINPDSWRHGMVKGHLSPSGFDGIWNVRWIDSMFGTLENDIKAQQDKNGTLEIKFPYQDSMIRLHPVATPEAESDR